MLRPLLLSTGLAGSACASAWKGMRSRVATSSAGSQENKHDGGGGDPSSSVDLVEVLPKCENAIRVETEIVVDNRRRQTLVGRDRPALDTSWEQLA